MGGTERAEQSAGPARQAKEQQVAPGSLEGTKISL